MWNVDHDDMIEKVVQVPHVIQTTTKPYKLYDLVARKVIMSRDVQFFKNESWDGTIDINVKIVSNVNNDDMEEEVVQTPHVSQLIIAPSTPMTP